MTNPMPLSARAWAHALAAALTDPSAELATATHPPVPQSLATGAAGVALLHLERAYSDPVHANTAHAWITAATAEPVTSNGNATLFHGVPALAFTVTAAAEATSAYHHAHAQLEFATAKLTRARLDTAHARIDRRERPTLAEFDLIRGLTGLGALHLYRDPHSEITAAVLNYLVRLTLPLADTDDLPGWWSEHGPRNEPSEQFPGGHGNLGLAHGITGPLALLAIAARAGILIDGHHDAITRIFAWLDTWQRHHPAGTWWPRIITLEEARTGTLHQDGPQQPSWCYGTPGIARAQQLAALATGDAARQALAEAALADCLADPGQLARIVDVSLCHGAAGLLHTTWRAAHDATTPALTNAIPRLAELLIRRLADTPERGGLLEGSTGAALALHTLTNGNAPRSLWDRCLLLA
ncbi:lanthionine synthetase C family protein [Allokutzneria multivorans]|uniref:Lanthionine synthetase C family protein n=1 Tax=Allokutzneria multivorans TaxID=1142134 RepID=A0ABP7SDC3_9PSEU